jgi:cytochrome b
MKTLIWNLPIRISHWFLAIGFTVAYLTGENHFGEQWHYGFGALAASIAFMRIVYGLIGGKYAHFKDFEFSPIKLINYLKTMWLGKNPYVGHNPIASYIMLGILLIASITGISGYLLYQAESQGIYNEDLWEEVHEISASLFLFFVLFHLAGLVLDRIVHPKDGTLLSMFVGYKQVSSEPSSQNTIQKVYHWIWFLFPIALFWFTYSFPSLEGQKKEKDQQEVRARKHEHKSLEKRKEDNDDD